MKYYREIKDGDCMFLAKTYQISEDGLDPAKAVQMTVFEILDQVALLAWPLVSPLS